MHDKNPHEALTCARRLGSGALLAASLTLLGCYDPDKYLLGPENADRALTVTVSAPTLPADGTSRTVITAALGPTSDATKRNVTFKTTLGRLYAGSPTGAASVTVPTDTSGLASAELESESSVGTARVQVSVDNDLVVRTVDVPFVTPPAGSTALRLASSADSAPADGATITRITATVPPGLSQSRRRVKFTTTLGFFDNSGRQELEVSAGIDDRATIDLRSDNKTGLANVRATLVETNATDAVTVRFVLATPDRIAITTDDPDVQANGTDSTVVRVRLIRDVGTVTAGTIVSYTATDPSGNPVGTFSGISPSDQNGESQAVYSPRTTLFRGIVTIQAAVGSISQQATVEVIP